LNSAIRLDVDDGSFYAVLLMPIIAGAKVIDARKTYGDDKIVCVCSMLILHYNSLE